MADQQDQIVVRGLCACGRKYRIRNARPGVRVPCPNCDRMIEVTAADCRVAVEKADEPPLSLTPLEHAVVAPVQVAAPNGAGTPWAVVIDRGELRVAPAGSSPGLTGGRVHESDEARMFEALRGTARLSGSVEDDIRQRGYGIDAWFVPGRKVVRSLGGDLLASLYLAGNRRNVTMISISTLVLSIFSFVLILPSLGLNLVTFVLMIFGLVGLVLAFGTVLQFYTSVLVTTAEGDDDIPLRDPEWSFIDAVVWPIFVLLLITAMCGFPAFVLNWYMPPDAENRGAVLVVAGLVGSLFWPIATMSVLVGGSLGYLRPDWLIACIARIGPAYLLPWALVMATIAIWPLTWWLLSEILAAVAFGMWLFPFWFVGVNLYFGYVLFRTIGLVYRHFGDRLPKKLI